MIASIVLGLDVAALAQDVDDGKSEFRTSCATCHGIDGKGGGPFSEHLKVAPADLTVLARKMAAYFR